MASQAGASSCAGLTQEMGEMRLSERQLNADDENRFSAIPRAIHDPAPDVDARPADKGKGRATDEALGFEFVDSSTSQGSSLDKPEHREVEPGIHMWRSQRERSPFTINDNPFIYCVDFDGCCYVDNVTFFGSILINVSFKGCFFSNVKFTRVFLQDMEFVNCDFSDFDWAFGNESDQTWSDRHLNATKLVEKEIPPQIVDPKWLEDLMRRQTGWATWVETHGDGSQPSTNRECSPSNAHTPGAADPPSRTVAPVSTKYRNQWSGADYDSYSGPLDRATRERVMADWYEYAAEQEKERDEEEFQKAIVESLKEGAASTKGAGTFHADEESKMRQHGAPSSGKSRSLTEVVVAEEEEKDDEENGQDGPVYSPACRL